MIGRGLVLVGVVAAGALGLLAVPLAAAAPSAEATCELRDVSQPEGTDVRLPDPDEPGTPTVSGTNFDFVIACQVPADVRFELDVLAEDGTATRNEDYGIGSHTVHYGPFTTPQNLETPITVGVLADPHVEEDETFTLRLATDDTSVVLTDDTAVGTIVNDDGGAPCLLISATSADVSAPLSTPTRRNFAGPVTRLTAVNCGGSDVNLVARGTNATAAGSSWELTNRSSGGGIDSICELGRDLFRTDVTIWKTDGGGVGTPLTTEDAALLGDDGLSALVLAPVTARELSPNVEMPCEGSTGLGQPMTMDIVLTAVAP